MDTISLTYEQLAERLGVKYESARKTTQRRRWRKSRGNDGHTRVEVPLEELPPEEVPEIPQLSYDQIIGELKEAKARLEAETAMLRQMLERSDLTIGDHKAMIEHWRGETAKWQQQADFWQVELKNARLNSQRRRLVLSWFARRKTNGAGAGD
jgi:hypothetical protein